MDHGIDWTSHQLYHIDDGDGYPTACKVDLPQGSGVALVLFTGKTEAMNYASSFTKDLRTVKVRMLARKERNGILEQYDIVRIVRKMRDTPSQYTLLGVLINPLAHTIGTFVSAEDIATYNVASKVRAIANLDPKEQAMRELLGDG